VQKITVITAYDFNTARALEESGVDYILVGDSLAMVALGYADTKRVSLGEMLICTRAVHRGAPKTPIITDMPLQAVSKSINDSLKSAEQIIKAGANFVKIENAEKETLKLITKLVAQGIPVFGHIGYTPQSFDKPIVVKDQEKLLKDAQALESAGVSGIFLEMIPSQISNLITQSISVPTIGIGAGAGTSGQVLVGDDLLGRYNLVNPKFLRRYANQYSESVLAFKSFIQDVRSGEFPVEGESY
jgi:3-methyl-2-oxobutanoate hydroxymethyltransferase